ncbi:restriction endonuclease [Candidatus Woesearchaeota archaeon]|nr:restriction endonuclease [Candidatus Woesearchaeota archaeon]
MTYANKKNMTPGELGHGFERDVRGVFESNGYVKVDQNKWMKNYDFDKDKAMKREYDLVMFKPKTKQFYIIECKAHFRDRHVGVKQVAEFYHKLENNNGRSAIRLMVTDTGYTRKAIRYAQKRGIRLVNGKQLKQMRNNGRGMIAQAASRMFSAGLEGIVKSLAKSYTTK